MVSFARFALVGRQILFNGAPRPRDFIAMCAVIPQEDTLYGALTPRETFTYVARLRLGDAVSMADKVAAAEAMLRRLELTKCADTPVGNEDIRGISGGEKKRTSIGCELIVNPAVLFVDEPTSGLDSKMARSVIEILQSLAHDEGRTVITVIHQPSWRIFSLFDALVLLKDGRIVFQGPVSTVQGYFANLGFEAPPHENPMDYYFDILQESAAAAGGFGGKGSVAVVAPDNGESGSKLADPAFFADEWARSEAAANGQGKVSDRGNARDVAAAAAAAADASGRTSLWSQFCTLAERCTMDYVKDKTKLVSRSFPFKIVFLHFHTNVCAVFFFFLHALSVHETKDTMQLYNIFRLMMYFLFYILNALLLRLSSCPIRWAELRSR
jgi:ABC-type multidrug transport system ATPase subunit